MKVLGLKKEQLADAWAQVDVRSNAFINNAAERAIEGTHVANRIKLEKGVVAGSYNYVVDLQGDIWLAPTNVHHSALVAAGADVRCAGQMLVRTDGQIFANTVSGHYMDRARLSAREIPIWEAAMRETISHAGMTPSQLLPDNRSLARFGFRQQ